MDSSTIVQVVTIIVGGIVTIVTLLTRSEVAALKAQVVTLKEQINGLNLLVGQQHETIAKLVKTNEALAAKSPDGKDNWPAK